MAIIDEIPEDFDAATSRIKIILVPNGERVLSPINKNWNRIFIKQHATIPINIGSNFILMKRIQFPIRYHLASTVHRIMEQTINKVATMFSLQKHYKCWEKEQLTVALSRTNFLVNIILVGTREDTINAIKELLSIKNTLEEIISSRINSLDRFNSNNSFTTSAIEIDRNPFYEILNASYTPPNYGFVYHSISKSKPYKSFIGQTLKRLEYQIHEDNCGMGVEATKKDHWELCCFVYGFRNDEDRKEFIELILNIFQVGLKFRPWVVMDRIKLRMDHYNQMLVDEEKLIFVKTAKINRERILSLMEEDQVEACILD